MVIETTPSVHLTYGLNVHPGESWKENLAAIRTYARAVKKRVSPFRPFGLGLRLNGRAARDLSVPTERAAFKKFLRKNQFYVFTVNAFPYRVFHGVPVKTSVYRPDWSRNERLRYTERVVRILADLVPDGVSGSVSTLPLGYAADHRPPDFEAAMIRRLAALAVYCARIRARRGCDLHVGLEPEPDCLLETTDQTIAFFSNRLIPQGVRIAASLAGCSKAAAEHMLRRHIGVCFDTCHLALQYEDLPGSLDRLTRAGVRISKIQLSAALRTGPHTKSRTNLAPFVDPVYLHQVKERGRDGCVRSRGDLETALASGRPPGNFFPEWHVHVHVPLHAALDKGFRSTSNALDRRFFSAVRRNKVEHLEIETYTFHVLPKALRAGGVVASIAGEFEWVLARWNKSTGTQRKTVSCKG